MRAVRIAARDRGCGQGARAPSLRRAHCVGAGFGIEGGVGLDARVSRQLLLAIHTPDEMNPLRGLTVIRGPRIERAAVPMSWDDLVEHAGELATGIAIAIEDSGDVRWLDRTGQEKMVDGETLDRAMHRRTLRIRRR